MRILKIAWKRWKAFGQILVEVQAYIIYGFFYITFMSIPGIISRLFFDLLSIKSDHKKSNFQSWLRQKETLSDARMQF